VQAYAGGDRNVASATPSIVRPTRLDPKRSTMVCAQCHTLRDIVASGYIAGADYFDYFQPVLEFGPRKDSDPTYWADGRPRRFSNDAIGFWESECFLRGGATCTSCHHDPHVPDVDRNPQLAPRNNALCTNCHRDLAAQLSAHTRHRADSAGSSCVDCHMPKTVISIKATMRDHTIGLPAPENTVAFGIPNACTECHKDKPATWAVAALEKWWPNGKRAKVVKRAEAFTAARADRPEALAPLIAIARDDSQGPLIQANAFGYLRHYQDARAVAALLEGARASHPAIRSTAISSLGHQVTPDTPVPRQALLAALDDPERTVRIAAMVSLINRGGEPIAPSDMPRFQRVGAEFSDRARLDEDNARIQHDLGLIELLTGRFDRAARTLQISLDLEPDQTSGKFFMALARLGQGRLDDARTLLKQVLPADPYYKAAQERLKQLEPR
jgi:predicted CXXCH cytochrome family protein